MFVQLADMFNMPSRPKLRKDYQESLAHLKDLEYENVKSTDISLLVGGNSPTTHLYEEFRMSNDDELTAFKTLFGWTLFGPCPRQIALERVHCSTLANSQRQCQDRRSSLLGTVIIGNITDKKNVVS